MSDTVSRDDARSIDKEINLNQELSGGVLPEDLFDEFYTLVQNESALLDLVRTVDLPRPQMAIPRIGVGERMIQESGTREDTGETENVSTDQVPMDVTKIDLKWSLPREVVEDSVDDVPDIIMDQMAQQFAVDTEELAIKGDAAKADPFLGILDGWFTIANSRGAPTYSLAENSNPQPVTPEKLNEVTRSLNPKYLREDPAFICNDLHVNQYFGELVDREDGLGVAVVRGDEEHNPFGHDLITSPVMPLDQAMFTTTDNLIYALHRDVEVDVLEESDEVFDKDLYAKYAMRARIDTQIEDENACLILNDIEDPTVGSNVDIQDGDVEL